MNPAEIRAFCRLVRGFYGFSEELKLYEHREHMAELKLSGIKDAADREDQAGSMRGREILKWMQKRDACRKMQNDCRRRIEKTHRILRQISDSTAAAMIWMHCAEGMQICEIARMYDVSASCVEKKMGRALERTSCAVPEDDSAQLAADGRIFIHETSDS